MTVALICALYVNLLASVWSRRNYRAGIYCLCEKHHVHHADHNCGVGGRHIPDQRRTRQHPRRVLHESPSARCGMEANRAPGSRSKTNKRSRHECNFGDTWLRDGLFRALRHRRYLFREIRARNRIVRAFRGLCRGTVSPNRKNDRSHGNHGHVNKSGWRRPFFIGLREQVSEPQKRLEAASETVRNRARLQPCRTGSKLQGF